MASEGPEAIPSFTLRRKMFRFNIRKRFLWRVSVLRRCIRALWNRFMACTIGKSVRYRQLPRSTHSGPVKITSTENDQFESKNKKMENGRTCDIIGDQKDSSDLVALKISILGDCHIGKTSFLTRYTGVEREEESNPGGGGGLHQMDKTLSVCGARIAYNVWEVEGDEDCHSINVPIACKDSVAMFFMFDLTSRCTLTSIIGWYQEARKWNQTAIPVLIGTKFDDFVQLPLDLQWTIANQARAYAKALNATLFFSSATYNINVNKIFKFITAKLFNLPWTLERNLTIGEPIIDF